MLVGSPTGLADSQECVASLLELVADLARMAASDGEYLWLGVALGLLATC